MAMNADDGLSREGMAGKLGKWTLLINGFPPLIYFLFGYVLIHFVGFEPLKLRSFAGGLACAGLLACLYSVLIGAYLLWKPDKCFRAASVEIVPGQFLRYFMFTNYFSAGFQALALAIFLFAVDLSLLGIMLLASLPPAWFVYRRNLAVLKTLRKTGNADSGQFAAGNKG